jgi:hypothetical protein
MSARILVELPAGHKVLFGGTGREVGLADAGIGDGVAKAGADKFKAALGSLAGLVEALEHSVGVMPKRPDHLELEFGAKLSGECDLWIVSGEGEAEFKVKLSWGKSA